MTCRHLVVSFLILRVSLFLYTYIHVCVYARRMGRYQALAWCKCTRAVSFKFCLKAARCSRSIMHGAAAQL